MCPVATQAESDLLATTGSDRSVALYDLRTGGAIRKVVMQTRCNAVAWNPMEAFNFVAANEDCNLYTYDMRRLNTAACVHQVLQCIRCGAAALKSRSRFAPSIVLMGAAYDISVSG